MSTPPCTVIRCIINDKVAVYIYVRGWRTKPTWDYPLTPIQNDGSWVCDITTGGNDQEATSIAAYGVPYGCTPLLRKGEATLLAVGCAVAQVEITCAPAATSQL